MTHCGNSVFLPAIVAIVLSAASAESPGGSPEVLLAEAVAEYRTALDTKDRDARLAAFRNAERLFSLLVRGDFEEGTAGIRNPDLFVNLGNAALGAERLGPAVLAYHRALAIDPDHHRARQNLDHARTLLPDWVPRPEDGGLLDTFFSWSGRLTSRQLQGIAAAAFLAVCVLLAASVFWKSTLLRNLALIPLLAWVVCLGVIAFRWIEREPDLAVVILPEVVARSADSAGAPPRLPQPLPSGTELRVVERRDDWIRVRLFDGRDAWVSASGLETVVPAAS